MKYRNLNIVSSVVIIFTALLVTSCTHSVLLTVPEYSEEALTWCGPATGQMIMDAYPSGSCYILQEDIWASILSNKTEMAWDTDPDGLSKAMIDLCPPSGTWVIDSKTDSTELMYDVARLMTKYKYPVAAVLNTLPHNSISSHTEHWIAIRGIVTDDDPTTNPTVNLQFVWLNDPAPAALGDPPVVRFIAASTWYNEFKRVTKATSSYNNNFVALIEPPKEKGKAIAPKEVKEGQFITPEQAKEFAKQWIKVHKLTRMKPYKILNSTEPSDPLLVNKKYRAYYLVPFVKDTKEQYAYAAMLINAYDGSMREVGTFNPVRYLKEEQATRIALKELNIKEPRKIDVELVSPPDYDFNKYFPIYKVNADGKILYVNRKGESYTKDLFKSRMDIETGKKD